MAEKIDDDYSVRFNHISIDVEDEDEEEVFEIGGSSAPVEPLYYDDPTEDDDYSDLRAEDDLPDYSLDDLPPMSFMQKVIIFILVAILVAGGSWIVNYFFFMN